MTRKRRSFIRDESGVTAVEFGLIAPPLLMMLMGLLDMAYNMYTSQMLHGAIQQAARNSTVEGAASQSAKLNNMVRKAVKAVAPGATVTFQRQSFANFTDVDRKEDWVDVDGNGNCDNGETFEDLNGSGTWDQLGQSGFGDARDVVLYTVTVTYQRAFPVHVFIPGQTANFKLKTSTVLRNQPFNAGSSAVPDHGTCA